jgi:hypothetical protein
VLYQRLPSRTNIMSGRRHRLAGSAATGFGLTERVWGAGAAGMVAHAFFSFVTVIPLAHPTVAVIRFITDCPNVALRQLL